jgi:hypothetical protein
MCPWQVTLLGFLFLYSQFSKQQLKEDRMCHCVVKILQWLLLDLAQSPSFHHRLMRPMWFFLLSPLQTHWLPFFSSLVLDISQPRMPFTQTSFPHISLHLGPCSNILECSPWPLDLVWSPHCFPSLSYKLIFTAHRCDRHCFILSFLFIFPTNLQVGSTILCSLLCS